MHRSAGLRFDSSWELKIFSLSHARDKTKNIFCGTLMNKQCALITQSVAQRIRVIRHNVELKLLEHDFFASKKKSYRLLTGNKLFKVRGQNITQQHHLHLNIIFVLHSWRLPRPPYDNQELLHFFHQKAKHFFIKNIVVLSKIVQNLRSVLQPSIFTQQNKISPNFPINLPRIKLEIHTLGKNTS